MNRLCDWLSMGCLLMLTIPATAAEDRPEIPGKVTAVTLYRGQAMVTRTISLEGAPGHREIIVTELPVGVEGDSLFAEGTGVEIRAVRYRERAVGEEPRAEVRELDLSIQELQTKLTRNQEMQTLIQQRSAYLENLENFVAGTAKEDLKQGNLDATSLEKLTALVFQERAAVLEEKLKLISEQNSLTDQIHLLQRKKNELTGSSSRTVREAVLFLNKQQPEATTVRLNYLVNNAGWSPAYNVRAQQNGEKMRVEYFALITQMTGEDWTGVDLVLSTASPALSSTTPGLAPFRVSLTDDPNQSQQMTLEGEQLQLEYGTYNQQLLTAQRRQNTVIHLRTNLDVNWEMNLACNGLQLMELVNTSDMLGMLQLQEVSLHEGPSIDYSIPNPVSIESRDDQQMVRIVELDLPAQYYHVASPMLSSYVFREAQLLNQSEIDLLGGPITVYLDGRFVGRGEIPTVARGQYFVIGLGADSQLRTRRELVAKTENIQGGNKELRFEYRLVLENYKDQPVEVRLMDRVPVTDREQEIRVTLGNMEADLNTDPLYVRLEKPKGLLRWDVEVPANSAGENAYLMEYEYKLEFDRNFSLTTHHNPQEQQQEFEELQNKRLKF